MSATSIISRTVVTSTSDTVAQELSIPTGTNEIWILHLSDDAVVTVEVNTQTETPAADAELYQMTNEDATMIRLPFYAEMESLFVTTPNGSFCTVEFRSR